MCSIFLTSMPMLLQIGVITCRAVCGAADDYYDNVHVGIQVGKEPRELVRGDAKSSSWTVRSRS